MKQSHLNQPPLTSKHPPILTPFNPSRKNVSSTNQSSFRRSSKFKSHLYFRMESMIDTVNKFNEFKGRRVPYFQTSFERKQFELN